MDFKCDEAAIPSRGSHLKSGALDPRVQGERIDLLYGNGSLFRF